jgi:hypothetical protein
MESESTPEELQITRATYELLKAEFIWRRRERSCSMERARMGAWYLIGPRSGGP